MESELVAKDVEAPLQLLIYSDLGGVFACIGPAIGPIQSPAKRIGTFDGKTLPGGDLGVFPSRPLGGSREAAGGGREPRARLLFD